jgi:uncharacterized membrane protein YfhO
VFSTMANFYFGYISIAKCSIYNLLEFLSFHQESEVV